MYNLAAHLWKQSGTLNHDKQSMIDPKNDAIDLFSQFIRIAPHHKNAPKSAITVAEAEYEHGRKQYLKLKELNVSKAKSNKALLGKMHGEFRTAIRLYDLILQKYEDDAEGIKALNRLGWINLMLGNHETASNYFLKHYNRLNKISPEKIASKYLAAIELGKIKKFAKANDYLGELLHVFDNNTTLLKFESFQNYHKRTLELLASNNEILAAIPGEL